MASEKRQTKKASKTKDFMDKIQKPPRQPENPVTFCLALFTQLFVGMLYEAVVTSEKNPPCAS